MTFGLRLIAQALLLLTSIAMYAALGALRPPGGVLANIIVAALRCSSTPDRPCRAAVAGPHRTPLSPAPPARYFFAPLLLAMVRYIPV